MSKHPRKTEMSRVSYSVAIDTVPLPEEPAEFVKLLAQQISDMFNLLVIDMVDSVAPTGRADLLAKSAGHGFRKQYNVAIDTVPLPEEPTERAQLVATQFVPVLRELIADALSIAAGMWPNESSGHIASSVKKQFIVAIDTVPLPE